MAVCDYGGGCGLLHAQIDARQAQTPTESPDGTPEIDRARRCARDRRCPDRQRVQGADGKPLKVDGHLVYVGVPITTERGLCVICAQTVRNDIPHLAADWRELAGIIAAGGDATGETVSSSRDLPVPIRLSVEALMRDIDVEATLWAEQVADHHGIDFDIEAAWASRAHVRVDHAATILANGVDTLVTLPEIDRDRYRNGERARVWRPDPDGDDVLDTETRGWREYDYWRQDGLAAALRMLELHDRTRILAGRGELVHKLPAPCPRCERLTLVRPNGKDHVECEACKDRWAEDDYKRLCLVLSSDENRRIRNCERCDKTGRLPNRVMCDHQAKKQETAA